MILDDLLKKLVERDGSDLHLLAGLRPAIRIHGSLTPLEEYEALTPESAKELIYSILSETDKKTFETDPKTRNELDFAYSIPGLGRFRCNIHKQRGTVAATIRALASTIPDLDDLGVPEAVHDFVKAKKGLVLVTGPTGSGKSTTLAAMISAINQTRSDHIITIEDPIEYIHNSKKSYVTQREVGEAGDTLTFKNALKYALRQDPDVILIGEMRDYETMGIAITSAETGHLVFGTLHTASAAQTIGRIIDVFPADEQPQVTAQLASNILGVFSQILLPKADGTGRILACEVMKANVAIRNNIRSNKPDALYQTIQTSTAEGMQTMDQCLVEFVKLGKITYDAAMPYLRDEASHRTLASFAAAQTKQSPPSPPTQPQPPPQQQQSQSSYTKPPWEQ